ncbi:MAG: hypothetical protein JRH15_14825, partial [Deltaproteobacteria bacterium]|nr:hypothetical protein [Deltaproteobacteria bacterium]
KIIDLEGDPRNRGRIHGEELRLDIQDVIENYTRAMEIIYQVDGKAYLEEFMAYQDFEGAIRRWAPDLFEEVQGIAEGANVTPETALMLQLCDEEATYGVHRWFSRYHQGKCSTFAVKSDGAHPTLSGQNMDLSGYTENRQVLFRITDDRTGLETYIFSYAGIIALDGVNNSPLGVVCNSLWALQPCNNGLPTAFVLRRILDQTNFDDAVGFLHEIKHAGGQNFVISTPDQIGSFECSANNVKEYRARDDGMRVVHTNRALVNTDRRAETKDKKTAIPWVMYEADSRCRFASIGARLAFHDREITLEDAKNALRAKDDSKHPVSRELGNHADFAAIGFTTGSVIYELSDAPKLHIASGPPSITEYRTFPFPFERS